MLALTAPSKGICAPRANSDQNAQPVRVEGIIDRVIGAGSEQVFRAGGYTFHILPTTQVRFGRGLQALNEVNTNTWATLEGKPDSSGVVVATKASFARLKLPNSKPADQVTIFPPDSKIDGDLGFATGPKAFAPQDHGGWCGWYDITQNPTEQEHIRRLGMKLVPQYQRDLPTDDPAKIPFRFYMIEERETRTAIFCANGLVLVPVEIVNRLQNEDQLAAVLADGIAGELLLQADKGRPYTWKDGAILAVSAAMGVTGSAPAVVGGAGAVVMNSRAARIMEHERGRMALTFTADAGFDPHQAPKAWQLLAPSHLPKDLAKLKDSERSLYLQNILETQYKTVCSDTTPEADHASATVPRPGSVP